ncbi:MAG: alanine racemase [Alphaproteobacteria bacterium]|nr:alanine racemase [Alphaproteobacteria bacterium]
MMQPTIRVNLDSLVANWRLVARACPGASIAAVVKADAYGMGADRIAPSLAHAGCRRFYVAWPSEGARLRSILGQGADIVVLLGADEEDYQLMREAELEPVLNSPAQAGAWMRTAGTDKPYSVHVDTGMNRLGASPSDWAEMSAIAPAPVSVISHLASADDPASEQNSLQLRGFQTAAHLWPAARRSLSASAGAWLGRDFCFDEIRAGIGLYGAGPAPRSGPAPACVATFSASILQTRTLETGDQAGYGGTFTAPSRMRIGTLGVGYADGFPRSASNRANVVIRGERRPVVGRVSMDLTLIDITGLPAKEGDEAELFGPSLPIEDQAQAMGTIGYELLTRIGPRCRKVYVDALPE